MIQLDEDRLRSVLEAEHSYYGSHPPTDRRDERLKPQARDLIVSQFRHDMRVLDTGCGNGETLLHGCHRFASGMGVDNDAAHIRLAEKSRRGRAAINVEFQVMEFLGGGQAVIPGIPL